MHPQHTNARSNSDHSPHRPAFAVGIALALVVAGCLFTGIVGGLIRAGVLPPLQRDFAVTHAFLMICGFIGTAIAIERAVAVRTPVSVAAVAGFAAAGVLTIFGLRTYGAWLGVVGALLFVAVNARIYARSRSTRTALLLVAAIACVIGNALQAGGARLPAVVPWWFCFPVLTVAAERLAMTRMMRRPRGAAGALHGIAATLVAGCVVSVFAEGWGRLLFGIALCGLAVWLACFDIARRTVRAGGLSRYAAVCLLLGYGWLGVAGVAWIGSANAYAPSDVALHALGLGFIFGMIFGQAPVVLPAVAHIDIRFSPVLYAPLALLHATLALRLAGAPFDAIYVRAGAAGNAIAIVVFAATIAGLARSARKRASSQSAERHDIIASP